MKKYIFFLSIIWFAYAYAKKHDQPLYIDTTEKYFLEKSERKLRYHGENFPVIVTENLSSLAKLIAIHFIRWVNDHPSGVISLPASRTPEVFIKYLHYYKNHWKDEKVQHELKKHGIEFDSFPNTTNLKFVQIGEYFPIDTNKNISFTHYVKKYYKDFFGLKDENILTMDGSLLPLIKKHGIEKIFKNNKIDLDVLSKPPITYIDDLQQKVMKEISEFCKSYENTIRKWGGIGLLIERLGADGHIAFNQENSWHNSKTRLVKLNYRTAAEAAINLGGIENSHEKHALTIGLDTICYNKDIEIIIIASGDTKGPIVAQSIESPISVKYPATAFHKIKNSKFYITKGCEKYLENRKHLDYQNLSVLPSSFIYDTLIEISLLIKKPLFNLTVKDLKTTPSGTFLSQRIKNNFKDMKLRTQQMLIKKIEKTVNVPERSSILHTSPHHDDILLSYYHLATKLIGNYDNIFCAITSGYNSVTNSYLKFHIEEIEANRKEIIEEIQQDYSSLFHQYKKAYISKNVKEMNYVENCIIAKKITDIYKISSTEDFFNHLEYLIDYLNHIYPGQKDTASILILKGAIRESEEERVWYISGLPLNNIVHLRSKFYSGFFFNNSLQGIDIKPMIKLIEKWKPSVITLALDPEGTGPDTHYKSLQLISSAILSTKNNKTSIWGYRNVWHRFKFSEANLFFLVTEDDIDELNNVFVSCYSTQKKASFPSPYFNGLFSKYTEKIQREQLENLKILLGKNYFNKHLNKHIREAKGLILIKEMDVTSFVNVANELRNNIEM